MMVIISGVSIKSHYGKLNLNWTGLRKKCILKDDGAENNYELKITVRHFVGL